MTTTLDDTVAVVRTCRARGMKLGVGYHLRQHPGVRSQDRPPPHTGLRQWWDDPELIGHASIMMGTGVYVVDALRFVLDQEVVEVSAVSDGQTPDQPLEHVLAMALRFDGGVIATVCCGRRRPDSRNDLVIYGSLGRLVGSDALWEGRQGTFELVSETAQKTETYLPQPLANFIEELADFLRAIREDCEPVASGLDGLRVVQVTLAMIAAARDKRTSRVEPLSV